MNKLTEDNLIETSGDVTPGTGHFAAWLAGRGQTDPMADPDGNGWNELLTYALGSDLASGGNVYFAALETLNVGRQDGEYMTLTYQARDVSPEVDQVVEVSTDLVDWNTVDHVLVSEADQGSGVHLLKYRAADVTNAEERLFMRLRTVLTP